MKKTVALIGDNVNLPGSLIRYINNTYPDPVDLELIELSYKSDMDCFNSINPDIVVYTSYEYWSSRGIFKTLWKHFSDKLVLLNADDEELFEKLATVDDVKKLSYSVGCSFRQFFAGDIVKDEQGLYKFEYYSLKHSRGIRTEISVSYDEMQAVILSLALCELIGINVYVAIRSLYNYFSK